MKETAEVARASVDLKLLSTDDSQGVVIDKHR